MAERKAKSPYQRYKKTPYKYDHLWAEAKKGLNRKLIFNPGHADHGKMVVVQERTALIDYLRAHG